MASSTKTPESRGGFLSLPSRNRGPWASLWSRVAIACACLVITTLVVWWGRAGYRDLDGKLNDFLSCIYYATVSLSTTGYGDITPVTPFARMMNVVIVTPLRFIFLITLVGTTVEVLTSRGRDEYRRKHWRNRVHDHTIVVGYGVKGRAAIATLLDSGINPAEIVVIAEDTHSCQEANTLGLVTVRGDARREDVLREALIATATTLIVAASSDDVTVLITLTAKQLNPNLSITVAARESSNAQLMRQSGATSVIMTAESAGQLLAISQLSPTAGAVIADLIDPLDGLEVVERAISPGELGMAPTKLTEQGSLVLAIIRDGVTHRFDETDIKVLQTGDRVVLIRNRDNTGKA